MSSRRLEDVLEDEKLLRWRCIEDVLKTHCQDVLRTCLEEVLKTCLQGKQRHVLKTSWRQSKCLLWISTSNHDLITNLNQYLTNFYLTNLYFASLRRIQNSLRRIQCFNQNQIIFIFVLFWNSISRFNSKSTLQNRWGNKNEFIPHKYHILHKYIQMSDRLYSQLYLINLLIYWWRNQVIDLLQQKCENNTWRRKKF